MKKISLYSVVLASTMGLAGTANAASFAVFGDNGIDNLINGLGGHSATLVTNAEVETPNFLNSFDGFVYTRAGASLGTPLSAVASAAVSTFVTGNVVLMLGDFADGIGNATVDTLWGNVVNFAASGPKSFIGEFNGAVAALSSNSNATPPLNLVAGSAGPLGSGNGGSNGNLNTGASPDAATILSGVSMPFNPASVEFGATISGFVPGQVVAAWDNGNPAIIAASANVPPPQIPLPAPIALLASGLGLMTLMRKRGAH